MNPFSKKIGLLILLGLLARPLLGQSTEGVVSYERVEHWTRVIARLTFLSREEKDRAAQTWKNYDEDKSKMKLLFGPNRSLYTYESERAESDDGTYSWRHSEYVIERNFAQETKTEIIEMLGRTYLLNDSLLAPAWRIGNQVKDVAGHLCVKAVADDTVRGQKITAWFAQDIPVPAGPERYYGLPGLILELDLNDGDVVVTATKVDFKPAEKDIVLPKSKGRKINDAAYNLLIANHIRDSIKAQRNPFWAIRY